MLLLMARTSATDDLPSGFVLALRQVAVSIDSDVESGFGVVIGASDMATVVATAAHVVWDKKSNRKAERIEISYADSESTNGTAKLTAHILEPVDQSRDLAFLAMERSKRPAEFPIMAAKAPEAGDPAWILGSNRQWSVSQTPGSVDSYDAPQARIRLNGLSILHGTSGAPVFTADGWIGIVQQRVDKSGDALPVGYIKAAFDRSLAPQGYAWMLSKQSLAPRTGAIVVTRIDSLSDVSIELLNNEQRMPISSNVLTSAPIGQYKIQFAALDPSSETIYVTCAPDRLDVRYRETLKLAVQCRINLSGKWAFSYGGSLVFESDNVNGYLVKVVNESGAAIGSGSASITNNSELHLLMRDSVRGPWSATGSVHPYLVTGALIQMSQGDLQKPYTLSRQ